MATADAHTLYAKWSVELTRIIRLAGDLSFGDVTVNQSLQRVLVIHNDGNSLLAVSSISYPTGFSGAWVGTIAAGSYQDVPVTFSPTAATSSPSCKFCYSFRQFMFAMLQLLAPVRYADELNA